MPTLNQLIRHGREEKRRTDRTQVLVFGLLVTRAKNLVHSVLFPIPVFCSGGTFFYSLPIIRKLSIQWQFLWFYVVKSIIYVFLIKSLFAVGYLWMDDLSRALSQFYPVVSGGLGGGGNTPMPPTNPSEVFLGGYSTNEQFNDQQRGSPSWSEKLPRMTTPRVEYDLPGVEETRGTRTESGLFLNLEVEVKETDPIEEQVEAETFRCEKVKDQIVEKTHSLLISKGYRIPDRNDIKRIIDVAMFNDESIDIDRRKKRFYYLYSCLGKKENPFWMEVLELLSDYNICLSDTDCDD